MASLSRPAMSCRQLCSSAPAKRAFSNQAFTAVRALTSPRITQLLLSRQRPVSNNLIRVGVLSSTRIAAFHASDRHLILPPLPQRIQGTANDAAIVPDPSPTHGSYHWTFERIIAAALIPLTIAPFATGSLHPVTDAVLCATLIIHSHVGFQSCIIDYFPTKRVPKTRAFFHWLLRGATLLTAVGLYEFETNDVGLTEGIKRVWKA